MIAFIMSRPLFLFFFFNAPATTEIYTLSLHDALPISPRCSGQFTSTRVGAGRHPSRRDEMAHVKGCGGACRVRWRSEEHTSELQSHSDLVCRLLLEKKKKKEKEK